MGVHGRYYLAFSLSLLQLTAVTSLTAPFIGTSSGTASPLQSTGTSPLQPPSSVSGISAPSSVSASAFSVISIPSSSAKYTNSSSAIAPTSSTTEGGTTSSTLSGTAPASSLSVKSTVSGAPSSSPFSTGTVVSTNSTQTSSTAIASTSTSVSSPFFAIQVTIEVGIFGLLLADGSIGSLEVDVTLVATFQVVNKRLVQVSSSPLARRQVLPIEISTYPGAKTQKFTPVTPAGSVDTSFIFTGFGNKLAWDNALFYSGEAGYCITKKFLYATFAEDTSFCETIASAVIIPVPIGPPAATTVAPPSSTIINNVEYDINININIAVGLLGNANYFCDNADTFLAKPCPVCPPVKVFKTNLTYADCPCPVCPAEVFKFDSIDTPRDTIGPANCTYGQASCVSCKATDVTKELAIVPAPISGGTTYLVCPSSASSSVASVASASGPSAAQSAASKAIKDSGITVTVTQTAAPVASSTVVNLPCESCPAGSVAVTLPQAVVTPTSPGSTGTPAVKPISPAVPFTGSAVSFFMPVMSILCVALSFTTFITHAL